MEAIGSKVLFLILLVSVAVSLCFGRRSRVRLVTYYSSSGSSSSSYGRIAWTVGISGGVFVVLICFVALYECCKKMRERRQRQRNAANAMLLLREITYQLT